MSKGSYTSAWCAEHTPVRQTFLDFFFTFCGTFLPHPSASALMSYMSSTVVATVRYQAQPADYILRRIINAFSCLYMYTTDVSCVSLLNANCTSTTKLALFPTRTYPLTEHTFNVRENSIPLHTPQISYVQSYTYAHPCRNMCVRDIYTSRYTGLGVYIY